MKVNEIFTSIEGEGLRAGELCTFIRFTGCNLRCEWCDTAYSFTEGAEMPIDEIMDQLPTDIPAITLTGGEPLIQRDIGLLTDKLIEKGYEVNIETNGAVDISGLNPKAMVTMDYKLPSSGMEQKMILDNLSKLRDTDVLKFVIGSEEDLVKTEQVIKGYRPRSYIYLSTVFGKMTPERVVGWMKQKSYLLSPYKVRFQLQIHKFVWNPETRGV